MRLSALRYVDEADSLPRGYGVAWYEFATAQAVCLPVPLNVCAGALRRAWLWFRSPWRSMTSGERMFYERGKRDGREEMRRELTA